MAQANQIIDNRNPSRPAVAMPMARQRGQGRSSRRRPDDRLAARWKWTITALLLLAAILTFLAFWAPWEGGEEIPPMLPTSGAPSVIAPAPVLPVG